LFDQFDKSFAKMLGEEFDSKVKKCCFMVEKGIALGHVISHDGIEFDKANINFIARLPLTTCVKQRHF